MATRDEVLQAYRAQWRSVSETAQMVTERLAALGRASEKWDHNRVYRALQRGDLVGLCDRGRWTVEARSIETYLASRQADLETAA